MKDGKKKSSRKAQDADEVPVPSRKKKHKVTQQRGDPQADDDPPPAGKPRSKRRRSDGDGDRDRPPPPPAPAEEEDEEEVAPDTGRAKKKRKAAKAAAGDGGAEPAPAAEGAPAHAEGADVAGDDEVANSESLLKLRSLLAPPGSDTVLPTPKAPAGGLEDLDDDEEVGKVHAEGPDWTNRYHVVSASDLPTPLEKLPMDLHPAIERALRKAGFSALFPIQSAVVPLLARSAESFLVDVDSTYSCDVCIAAPTGQGKTLAYALPIVQALLPRLEPKPRALVVVPTRDLALQVYRVFEVLRRGLGSGVAEIRALCLTGEKSFAQEKRMLEQSPPDIIVCTPGRLSDHFFGEKGCLDLSELRWFIADEADRLLQHSFHRWLDVLEQVSQPQTIAGGVGKAKPRLQKLLLSATMTWNPQKLAMLKLRRPLYFFSSASGQYSTPAELRQHMLKCKPGAKPLAVLHLLGLLQRGVLEGSSAEAGGRVVVFCSSVDDTHRLARLLQIFSLLPELLGEAQDSDVATNAGIEAEAAADGGEEEADEECSDVESKGEEEKEGSEIEVDPRVAVRNSVASELRGSGLIAEFSSTLAQKERNATLKRFRRAEIKCLVCSDVVARGIDIPEVQAVINYSTPAHLQTYIHRVGRTARAGRTGHTFTFVPRFEMKRFEQMLRKSADCWDRIKRYPLPVESRNQGQKWYRRALKVLKRVLKLESLAKISPSRPLTLADLQAAAAERGSEAAAAVEKGSQKASVPATAADAPLESEDDVEVDAAGDAEVDADVEAGAESDVQANSAVVGAAGTKGEGPVAATATMLDFFKEIRGGSILSH